jgi:hypothetical protein
MNLLDRILRDKEAQGNHDAVIDTILVCCAVGLTIAAVYAIFRWSHRQ